MVTLQQSVVALCVVLKRCRYDIDIVDSCVIFVSSIMAVAWRFSCMQVLMQDVRSVHQGRGFASSELYECCFDGVVMHFVTTEDEMRVVSAE